MEIAYSIPLTLQLNTKTHVNATLWLTAIINPRAPIAPLDGVKDERSEVKCTFTTALHLPAAEQGVVDEVGQAPVEVHGGQAALEALAGDHQLGKTLVHVGAQAPDEQIT